MQKLLTSGYHHSLSHGIGVSERYHTATRFRCHSTRSGCKHTKATLITAESTLIVLIWHNITHLRSLSTPSGTRCTSTGRGLTPTATILSQSRTHRPERPLHTSRSAASTRPEWVDSETILEEVTETKWISLQHEPREFPF